ncbi:MAG: hypothetical protein HYS18_14005 [Burkholderiales bacterium]|nr:hypothetical protein [Burkholderiales bacterium]
MSKSMQLALVVIVLAAAGLAGYYFTHSSKAVNSFAPERPEQAGLAKEHAECAAFYSLPQAKEGSVGANSAAFLQFHADAGKNFSEDKQAFSGDVNADTTRLTEQAMAAQKSGSLDKFVADKDAGCKKLMGKSGDFVADVMRQRSGKK